MRAWIATTGLGKAGICRAGIAAIVAGGAAAPAMAQVPIPDSSIAGSVTLAAVIGLLAAIPGLALLATARATGEAVAGVATRAIAATAGIALLWAVIGFTLANAPGTAIIGGLGYVLLGGQPDMGVVLIELALALAAGGIVAQAGGARAGFGWSSVVAIAWVLLVYVPISWWARGEGWLANFGALDAGGGLTLHLSAGVSALVLSRIARPASTDGSAVPINVMAATIGGALVWIGLLALIAGTAAAADSDMAGSVTNGLVAASAGALVWLGIDRIRTGVANPLSALLGGIGGIAAVSAGAIYIGVAGAIIAGALAGGIGAVIAGADGRRTAFATHGIGGAVGAALLAFLFLPVLGGPGYEAGATVFNAFTAEMIAVAAVVLWSAIVSLVIGYAVATVLPATGD